jgi:hypothetical protein
MSAKCQALIDPVTSTSALARTRQLTFRSALSRDSNDKPDSTARSNVALPFSV